MLIFRNPPREQHAADEADRTCREDRKLFVRIADR
jgi:hypothetical protein